MLLQEDVPAATEPEAAQPMETSATEVAEEEGEESTNAGWLSLLPALLAIVLALAFRQVVVSLFVGVWAGAWIWWGPL